MANVVWVVIATLFFGIFLDVEINESRFDWGCALNNVDADRTVQGKCFVEYEGLCNKLSVPPYVFVIVNFSLPFLFCVIYSEFTMPRVKSLVNRADVERGQNETVTLSRQRKLFIAYFCQLAARLCIGIVFIVLLLTEVFYPREFPSNFICNFIRETDNQTAYTTGNATTRTYKCNSQRGHKKTLWMYALVGVNGIFAVILLIEIVIILSRARKGKHFMNDSQFYNDHLKSNNDQQDELKRRKSRQEISLLVIPQQELQDSQEGTDHEILEREHSTQFQTAIKCMKETVMKNNEQLEGPSSPFKPNPGEGDETKHLKLDQIYTNVIIYPGRAKYDFPKDRLGQLKVYPKPEANLSPKRPGDIFDDQPKKILIVGRPGIGKTLYCSKLMRDWASDRLFDQAQNAEFRFEVAFLVKFKRLNSSKKLNLRELLNRSEFSMNVTDVVWDYILENPNKVLLIFDGVDEFSGRKEINGNDSASREMQREMAERRMPLHALYSKILSGELLDGAFVLTTTRPTAVSCVTDFEFSRVGEILGFSSEQVENYVEKFTDDDKDAKETIWQHISNNLNLFSLCYIPVNCFIICSCLLYILKTVPLDFTDAASKVLPTKLTHIYNFAVKIFYFWHSDKYRNKTVDQEEIFKPLDKLPDDSEVKKDFKKLGKIAFKGIKEGRLTFESDEVTNLEDCGLLHRLPDLKMTAERPDKGHKAQYCFVHLTIQEFLAAKHIADFKNENKLRKFVSRHIEEGAWQVVLQFVAGLLVDRDKPLTDIFTNLLPASTYEEESSPRRTISWPISRDAQLALTLCHCLYEINADHSAVRKKIREIGFNAVVFKNCQLGPTDCTAIVNFVKMSNKILMIGLEGNNIGPLGCKEIGTLFSRGDSDSNRKLKTVSLDKNSITDEGVKYLAETLKHSNCELESLTLESNKITFQGVKYLIEALKHSNCKLSSLNFAFNNITDEGVMYLAEALKESNCKLNTLNLWQDNITDEGVKYLAGALKHSNCKLNSLNLGYNGITNESEKYLTEALMHSNCKLKSLDLRNTTINKRIQSKWEAIMIAKSAVRSDVN